MKFPDPARFGKAAAPLFGEDWTIAVCPSGESLAMMEGIGLKGVAVSDALKFGAFMDAHMTSLTAMAFIVACLPGEGEKAKAITDVLKERNKAFAFAIVEKDAGREKTLNAVRRALMLANMSHLTF